MSARMDDLAARILYIDAYLLVLNKPAGLAVHPGPQTPESLEDHLYELREGFHRPPQPAHRLDRDTSGCLLLARNPKALKRYNAAFEARTVEKVYLGLVAGSVEGDEGTINLALSKISSAEQGWRMIAAKKGKDAVTHWRKLAERSGLTLVEFRPETGRTHQIRVHAEHGLGHALLGDPVYGDAKGAKRTMLHARALTVPREGKQSIMATAPLPADFLALGFSDDDLG
jgi:tRNA pseudouridine32 synthase/23S rRNA pseudouridine746 synthase